MLVQMHCTTEEKLECATSLLQDETYQWWVSVTRTAPPERVTWRFFLDEFKKHYVSRIYLNNMRREFHNLKQRQLSVTEYVREFTRLSKYAPEMLVSEEEKCRKFEDGLSDQIRAHVTGPDPDTPPGFPGWSRLVEFLCTIPRECIKGPHLKEI